MKKRRLFLSAALLLLFSGLFVFLYVNNTSRLFRKTTEDFFAASLAGDSLSLHYTLADPSGYLTPSSPASLPLYSAEARKSSAALLENFLTALRGMNPEKLNRQDRYTYSLLLPYLENELTGLRCEYFEEPLSPTSGVHTELPVLLAEYTFRSQQDLEDYLDILESIPAYLESLSRYEKEKAAAGLFMTEADAAEVVKQCDNMMDPALLEAGEHFLQITFRERLEELTASGEVDEAQKDFYLAENDRLLKTVAAPAYVSLADDLFLLAGSGSSQGGLCLQKSGLQYYTYLVKRNTGSSRTPEEISELLSASLQETFQELQAALSEYQQLTGQLPTGSFPSLLPSFPLEDAAQILEDLQQRMQQDFPALSSLTGSLPACRTRTVDASMEEYTSPAFYLTPPRDDLSDNVIYINNALTAPGLELYTTLAHEGYPGHLYQTVYSQLYENTHTSNPIRSILYYGGYVEGWAYYTENLAYDYAAALLSENGATRAEQLLVRISCLERNLQVNLYCLLDLSIHYYGALREDVCRTLAAFGISDQAAADSIYDYIRREPSTYLKYYLGYLEILALQREAQELWKDAYTPLRFHTLLLQCGPSDFTALEKIIRAAA